MKRILFFLVLISVFSCQQIDLQYACDPEINQIVVENLEEFSQISVFELSEYDYLLQKAIYNSWDYKKKRDAWINKFSRIIERGDFAEKEINHINNLINFIEPDFFKEEFIQENSGVISKFADDWIEYAQNELSWSKEFVAFLVYRIYSDQLQFEEELSFVKQLNKTTSSSAECSCSVSSDYCLSSICVTANCLVISSGCGFFWSGPCDGSCD